VFGVFFIVSIFDEITLNLVCRSNRFHQLRRVFLGMSTMSCSSAIACEDFFFFVLAFKLRMKLSSNLRVKEE
jgi:hypothetical protein